MFVRTVTSAQNPVIRAMRDLRHAKARQESGRMLVEGAKLCGEALRDAQVSALLVDDSKLEEYAGMMAQAKDVLVAPSHIIASVCETKTPQGIVASVFIPSPLDVDEAKGALLVLDGVQDPGNVGTMLRTAEAAGFSAALLSDACADAFAPKVVRATMGSVFRLPVWRGTLVEALQALQKKGYTVVASTLDGEPLTMVKHVPLDRLALLVGSEGRGIGEKTLSLADVKVKLPMLGRAESLNAAVAAGILMYGLRFGM